MTAAIVDTTVVLHLFRRYAPCLTWYDSISEPLAVTPITWMEVMEGAGSKAKQSACLSLLGQFDLIHLTAEDQDWAMRQMEAYRLSHGASAGDCFIAAVAHRAQLPLYTHNVKDMSPLIGDLAIKPYA